MGVRERAEAVDESLRELPHLYRVKHGLDRLLPVALVLIAVVLYLEFLAAETHGLYPYKDALQISILLYFITELAVDFVIYEQRTMFVKDRWLDILLTLPFFTAFKSVNGALRALHLVKPAKAAKAGKAAKTAKAGKAAKAATAGKAAKTGTVAKVGKSVKVTQKLGKLVTKGKKLVKKRLKKLL